MFKTVSVFFFILLFMRTSVHAEESTHTRDYSFIIQDSPSLLLTMRQVNESYLSASRLLARGLYSATSNDILADVILGVSQFLLFMPLTHEEGHRSILTVHGIGLHFGALFQQAWGCPMSSASRIKRYSIYAIPICPFLFDYTPVD